MVSLWAMLRFHADVLVKVINGLNLVEKLLGQSATFLENESLRPYFAGQVNELFGHLTEAKLTMSAKKALQLYLLLNDKDETGSATGELIKRYSNELRERIEDELEGKTFFYISDHVSLMSDRQPFGNKVGAAFPSAQYDITEAGHCLALRRSTACVVHLMRALEVALASLATALGLSLKTENWNRILNDIEDAIRSRTRATHGQQWKDKDEPFFTEAAAHFRLIKNAWRNHVMHGRDKYTEQEAEDIYRSVRPFMQHLSERLSEAEQSS